LGSPDKVATFDEYTDVYDIKPEHVLYMGTINSDYHVMKLVGLPTCPSRCLPWNKKGFQNIFQQKKDKGAVRDVIEQVMKVQGKWMES
jgi:3-deoxy-D-manno-octulosonate 8-phosphate phosphatase (KDO 8-P phosphatase)